MSAELRRVKLTKTMVEAMGVHPLALAANLEVPTVKEYLPEVIAAATPAMKRSYMSYWKRAETFFGELRLHEIRATKIEAFRQDVIANSKRRKGHCHGRYAGSQALSAMRKLYRLAVADGLVGEADDPAKKVRIARRLHSTRRALTPAEVADINQAMLLTSRDHELDGLILRLHLESACRRGGALALCLCDVDERDSRVLLRGKIRVPAVAADQPDFVRGAARPRGITRRQDSGGCPAAPCERPSTDISPLRHALGAYSSGAALGSTAGRVHALAAAHDAVVGRAPLRLRGCPSVCGPRRQQAWCHLDLPQRPPPRGCGRARSLDQ